MRRSRRFAADFSRLILTLVIDAAATPATPFRCRDTLLIDAISAAFRRQRLFFRLFRDAYGVYGFLRRRFDFHAMMPRYFGAHIYFAMLLRPLMPMLKAL